MRFLADGPSIPDELLIARDEGRVIFFCGAGVSRACAGLSDFFGLAEKVVETLGVTADDPVRKLLDEAGELERRIGIPGLISADRIFGLLERNFRTEDIEEAVSKILKPSPDADLSAHRIMLDLARSPEGKIRLVTTNFDLLFENCDGSLPKHRHPRLPDPNRPEDFIGIIHLHGHVDNDYQGASGDGFVLSSSEFGDAYLADGWATQFIRSILEKYVVVFVGYAADDPPVHYLLEALNKRANSLQKMYAFQVGTQNDAEARWGHKGVIPIAFDGVDDYKSLWDTMAAWAGRAVNTDAWYEKIIEMARKGPEKLQPHERGQVAHLVSSLGGARRFAGSDNPPPAEWLCVFDSAIRYLKPGRLGSYLERGPFFDPFEAYGLESDPVPPKIDPEDFNAKREVPSDAWNCFTPSAIDLLNLQIGNYAAFRGHYSVYVPSPPQRLLIVGQWLCRVSDQPAAVWWASHQTGIHPEIQSRILFELERMKKDSSPVIRRAWRYLFEDWKRGKPDVYNKWFQLNASIALDGWTNATVRKLAGIFRPYIKVEWPYWGGPKPPEDRDGVQLRELVNLTVEHPELHENFEIPDELLVTAVREFRKNLEYAVSLENELDRYWLLSLCPIEPDPDLDKGSYDRNHGISRALLLFVDLFKRMLARDPISAKLEFQAWWDDDDTIFARLRIWSAGQRVILDATSAGKLFCSLNDEVFWNSRHQRDFLLALKQRWLDIPAAIRKRLEKRLLRGRERWQGEKKAEYTERRAWEVLVRIHWLESQGCTFSFDLQAKSTRLQLLAPQWQQQHAAKAAASLESRGGTIRTNTEYSALLDEPLDNLLVKAGELSGRNFNTFVERDPFQGLSSSRPVHALSALHHAALKGEYPTSFWSTFLYSTVREKDRSRLMALIAGRIAELPTNALARFIHPVADWFSKSSKTLLSDYPKLFEQIWTKLILVIKTEPEIMRTSLVRSNKEVDWATEALNSPAGKLARIVMTDPETGNVKKRTGFPLTWISRVEELLELDDDHRRYVLVILSRDINWFHAFNPKWTEKNLLSILDKEGEDNDAFWQGILWSATGQNDKLFLRLKPYFIKMTQSKHADRRRDEQILSALLLGGWLRINKKKDRLVTNGEMREILLHADDEFRSQLLWYLEQWSSEKGKTNWAEILTVFFTDVWPRHKQAKSPKMSAKLCSLVFSNEELFPVVADIVLPLVTKVDTEGFYLPQLRGTKEDIIGKYPEKSLEFLTTILSEDVTKWPYGIGEAIMKIGEAEPSLLHDSRLIELKRRSNAR